MNLGSLRSIIGIEHPIIQGPFGGGLSTVELASVVSNGGGLGSYGAHHLSPEHIRGIVDEMRAQTAKPFAVNLWVSDHDAGGRTLTQSQFEKALEHYRPFYDELGMSAPEMPSYFGQQFEVQVEALIAAAPPVFSFVYGVPSPAILDSCRSAGIVTIGTATTVAEAVALHNAGVDIIVATGLEAGGHRVSFLDEPEDSLFGTLALVPQVVDAVSVPVVAAGGIADGRGIVAAFALGAVGAQIGTAFLATRESGTVDFHREQILASPSRPTVLTRAFTGRLARGIPNSLSQALRPAVDQLHRSQFALGLRRP